MNITLSKTDTRTRLEDAPRIKLRSRGQIYYRNLKTPMKGIDGKGEIIELMSRGVAYKKKVAPRIYKKPGAINWRWREALSQD
jgi:hypothetical protein